MGGRKIIPRSLKTTGNKNCFQPWPEIFFLNHTVYDPFIFAKNSYSKIRSINCDRNALCADLGPKCQNLFCLV